MTDIKKGFLDYRGRRIPFLGNYDTIVVGGGSAGVSAAISSAEGGCRTLIVEKSIRLGGTSVIYGREYKKAGLGVKNRSKPLKSGKRLYTGVF